MVILPRGLTHVMKHGMISCVLCLEVCDSAFRCYCCGKEAA